MNGCQSTRQSTRKASTPREWRTKPRMCVIEVGEKINRPVYEDITKNAPPVTARRNFGPGPLNGTLRRKG